MKKYILILILGCGLLPAFSQQTPAPAQTEMISIIGATAHTGNGKVIENSVISFDKGRIIFIGSAAKNNPKGKIIHAEGKHIYPGFIIPNSTLGLGEIDAVRATSDYDETGNLIPNVRSIIAYNAESKVVESMRPNGVLIAQITPRGGTVSGTSSVVQLDAWNWEDAIIKEDDGIHLNWPRNFKTKNTGFGRSEFSEINKDYSKEVEKIKNYLIQGRSYDRRGNKEMNLAFEALQGLYTGEKKLYIHARLEKELIDAIDLAKETGIKNTVLVGASEAYKITGILKTNNIPVLIQRVHLLPASVDDDFDLPYKMAAILFKKGVLTALEGSGDMERMNNRNLPFYAGTTTGYGLTDEEALQLITLNTARILGIDKDYGSLETGKSATLFISEGNALDMRTNKLIRAFIDGRDISLESHQTMLYKRYSDKYKSEPKVID